MKVSDYIISFLESYGVRDVFLLSGGGMMHLLDSLAQSDKIRKYYNLNEQATTFCADAYAQTCRKLGVCFVTTGPGATNAVTGAASAHIDSTPLLVISGQVRTDTMIGDRNVRQYGAQEVSIVSMVAPVTRYAVTIMQPQDVRYHLEKAVWLATHGRKGAVWLDIPLDIQGAQIEPERLRGFSPERELPAEPSPVSQEDIAQVYAMLRQAKRPVILAGSGVLQAEADAKIREFAARMGIPVLSSRRAKEAFPSEFDLYFGTPGSTAPRYANYILQNSDLLFSIGCGLRYTLTSYNERNFAPRAKKIINNIDPFEISKLEMTVEKSIVADAGSLLDRLLAQPQDPCRCADWLRYCRDSRERYALSKEFPDGTDTVDGYRFAAALSQYSLPEDLIIPSVSSSMGGYLNVAYRTRKGQRYLCPIGLGAMGSSLPAAIGACVASGKRRTILCEGDGSLQHNIQELALIKTYSLPIKILIENNGGYISIVNMQKNHFDGRLAGCNPASGVAFPALRDVAAAYGLRYERMESDDVLDEKMKLILSDDQPVLCEIIGSKTPRLLPAVRSRVLADGSMATSSMEDMFPFLPEGEHAENMRISEQ